MRRILLENISSGMRLAKPLYSAEGQVLLNAGTHLTERYVQRLKEMDVTYIYIEDELTQDIDIPDVISERARIESVVAAKNLMDKVRLGKSVDAMQAKKTTNMLVDELCRSHGTLMNFIDMRTRTDYLYGHAVSVCILSIMTGISLGYDELRLRDLGVGALLHDVGKVQISQDILNKNGRLTHSELEEIKKHPWLGFEILRKNPDISLISAHCAFQHHERYDGSGYPRGLKGKDITEYAHIIAIADVYDALTADNTYRPAVPVYEALSIILKAAGTYFDTELVNRFAENIAVYPIGTVVRLNTNAIGVVVDLSREFKTRPIVRIIVDENKHQLSRLLEIDLSKNPRLYIADVVER
jgi:HD-GYP domain-containing protein (c-di-GMP phosphodiesterase class II)